MRCLGSLAKDWKVWMVGGLLGLWMGVSAWALEGGSSLAEGAGAFGFSGASFESLTSPSPDGVPREHLFGPLCPRTSAKAIRFPSALREQSGPEPLLPGGGADPWGRLRPVSAEAEGSSVARVSAIKLLPENTVFLLWVPSAPELAKRFMNTAMGRMSQDPQMKPLVQDIYGSVVDAVANLRDQIGLSLPELLEIPQGEILVGVVAPEQGPLGAVLLLEAGAQMDRVRQLLARGSEAVEKQPNVQKSEQMVEDTKVVIYDGLGRERRRAVYCEKDGCLVLSTELEILKGVLSAWRGGAEKTLANNERFATIMKHCRGAKEQTPQFFWYLDPIGLLRKIGQENIQIRLFVASLPALGLDGVLGMGGSLAYDVGQFDEVAHFHLLLDNPRSGIVEMIALDPGEVRPEPWVPPDVASYTTFHWRFQTTLKNLAKIYDSFQGEGAFSAAMRRRIMDQTGIDLEKEILPVLDGRVTYFTRINREEPLSLQSNSWCWALRLKESQPIEQALEKLAKKYEKNIRSESFRLTKYYHVTLPEPPRPAAKPDSKAPTPQGPSNAQAPQPKRKERSGFGPGGPGGFGPQEPPRPPEPCLGIVQNYLIIADRPSTYEKVLTQAETPRETLADALDFKLIAAKIARTASGNQPVLIGFNRPEEGMRWLYDLVQSERTQQRLRQVAQENPFWKNVQTALEKNPLPPFEVLQQYLAPGGVMILDDETGLHYTAFTLRRGQPKASP